MKVERISRNATKPFLMDIHYAGRMPSISYAYGLFDGEALIGVCTFGTPSSAPLRSGVCGPSFADKVIELNRLCLLDNKKNQASFFVSACLRMLRDDRGNTIIISFADVAQGHVGYVYQACNFLYSGLSAKRTDWKVRGMEHLHGQTIADEFRGVLNRSAAMREKYGDDFYLLPRSRKHRYVTFLGHRKFKRSATDALRYKLENYPK